MKEINGVNWFFRLVPGMGTESLFGEYGELDKIVVCWEHYENRLFAYVDDHNELFDLILRTEDEHRCYYEVADGLKKQRPHFDIDLPASSPVDGERLVENLRKAIINYLPDAEVLIYSSHDRKKKSYHVIVYGYWHANHLEAQSFYGKMKAELSEEEGKYLDHSVYSKRQQFRCPACRKEGTQRVKFIYREGKKVPLTRELFRKSLLTTIDPEEKQVPGCVFHPEKREIIPCVGDDRIEKAFSLLSEHEHEPGAYRIGRICGSLVLLHRLKKSYCPVCKKDHERENPYLVFYDDGFRWNCRRSENGESQFIALEIVEVQDIEDKVSPKSSILPLPPPPVKSSPPKISVLGAFDY